MGSYKSDNRPRDRRGSTRRNFGGGDFRRPSLHDAVCDECGKDCQVPFRPSGDKPIYCSNCFEKKGGRDSNRPSRSGPGKRSFDDRGRSKFPQSNMSDRSTSQLIEKIGILNTNLETIINLLSSIGQKKSGSVEGRTEKYKKSRITKSDKKTEALAKVEKKNSDLKEKNTQENIKSKPKKRSKTKVDSSVKNKV